MLQCSSPLTLSGTQKPWPSGGKLAHESDAIVVLLVTKLLPTTDAPPPPAVSSAPQQGLAQARIFFEAHANFLQANF